MAGNLAVCINCTFLAENSFKHRLPWFVPELMLVARNQTHEYILGINWDSIVLALSLEF